MPSAPGLGVKLDHDKVNEYRELYLRLGPYPYDRDPLRPGWIPTIPNDRWADPLDTPEIAFEKRWVRNYGHVYRKSYEVF